MSIYNLEAIFNEGYVDSAALRLFLESLIEDQQELSNKLKTVNEKTVIVTKILSSNYDFIRDNNLYEEEENFKTDTININNKNIHCDRVIDFGEYYIKNIKDVECFFNIFELEDNKLKKEVSNGKINNAYIRTNSDSDCILIKSSILDKLKISDKHVVFLNLKYKATDDKENVEVTKNEEYSNFENLLFVSDI